MAASSEDFKLIISVTNFELVQLICSAYINVTDGRTDGQPDGRTTCNTSRGKKNHYPETLYFSLKMHQNAFGGRAAPRLAGGSLQRFLRPRARLKGERERGGRRREGKGGEGKHGKGKDPRMSEVR